MNTALRPGKRSLRPADVVCLLGVAALNVVWFTSFPGRTLMGDDLELLVESRSGGYASGFLRSLTQTGAEKYRPVLTMVLSVMTDAFGGNFTAYRVANLGVHVVNVALVGFLAWRLSRRSRLVTLAAMALVTVSRFNVYFVLQVYGVMEGLALAFMLCMLLAVERAWALGTRRPLLYAYAFFFLAVFTHERFVALGAFLVLTTLVVDVPFRSRLQRVAWAAVPVAVGVSNYAAKALFLETHYFTGVGGQRVEFNPGRSAAFVGRAVLNMVGFNTGPDYLSGRNIHALGALGVFLGLALAVPVAALLVHHLVAERSSLLRARWAAWRPYVLAAALFGPLLLTASITFRQEYRWLYAPYVAFVLGLSWLLGRTPGPKAVRAGAVLLVLAGGLVVDGYYRHHVERNTYFFAGLRAADSVREEVLEEHRSELRSTTVFLVTRGDPTIEGFYLRGGDFFAVYGPREGADIRLAPSFEAVQAAPDRRPRVLVFDIRYDDVVDVTSEVIPAPAPS